MNKKKSNNQDMDSLLKEVLKDDLPPEAENRMKRQFIRFREKIEQHERQSRVNISMVGRRLFRQDTWRWAHWMLRKEILAFSSIIMIAIGGFMHLSGHSSALAESFSMLRTSVSVFEQIRHAASMECTVQVPAQNGKSLAYSIQWISPDMTRVDVRSADEITTTLWVLDERFIIADHVNNTLHKAGSFVQIKDPMFQPVMGFLSPDELAERIYRSWQPVQYKQQVERSRGTFAFTYHEAKALLEMTIDLNTYLPVKISKFLQDSLKAGEERKLALEVHFTWNQPILPKLMVPEITKRSQGS